MSTIVTIPDTNFKNYLLQTLTSAGIIPSGTTDITDEDLAQLQQVSYGDMSLPDNEKIESLTGIEYCINLTSMFFPYNKLTALPNLSTLTVLTNLDLDDNQIDNLSEFSNLPPTLTSISLDTNQISTLPEATSFSRLTKLTNLYLSENKLTDITNLSGLPNTISQLTLAINQITDLSPLANLTSLTNLELYMNPNLQNISPLSKLINLEQLYIAQTQVSDVKELKDLIQLQKLWLHNNQITSVEGLENMTKLTLLTLNQNQIPDISPLKHLTALQTLELYMNKITDISPIHEMNNLQSLTLQDNQISNISALANKTNLTTLKLDNNHVGDLSPLKNSPLTQQFSATHQTVQLPNQISHSNRFTMLNPIKNQHGNPVPPTLGQYIYYNEESTCISWDNCYGWGTQKFIFESEDQSFNGSVQLFYQTFIPLNRHYFYNHH